MAFRNLSPALLPVLAGLPAQLPPPGVTANFEDPYSRASLLIILGSAIVGIMVVFVAVRFYIKAFIVRKASWDDLTCILAMLGTIIELTAAIILCKAGVGTHQWDLKIGSLISDKFLRFGAIFVTTQLPTMLFAKLSFYLLYLQIFNPNMVLRWGIYIGLFVTTGFYLATSICQFYYLIPLPGRSFLSKINFDPNNPTAAVGIATGIFGVISDFYILLLPISGVLNLQIPMRRKVGIITIFATGLFACVVSIVGLVYRLRSRYGTDGTWELLPPSLLAIIEEAVGVICSCMPACKRLIRHHSPSLTAFKNYLFLLRSSTKDQSYTKDSESNLSKNNKGYQLPPRTMPRPLNGLYSEIADVELGQVKTIKTYIHGGQEGDVDDNGIHLQQDIHQTSSKSSMPKTSSSYSRV